MSKFAVLVKSWSISVKSWYFFVDQGGTTQPWGKGWRQVEAHDLEAARKKGELARDVRPGPCNRILSGRPLKNHLIRSWSEGVGFCAECGRSFRWSEADIEKRLKGFRRRHNFKAAAARNAKAFASTKSKDGQYPI